MVGVSEASAVIGLMTLATPLSQAVIDIAGRYKNARVQIESFGLEVGLLGEVLDQFHRFLSREGPRIDNGAHSVTVSIVNQCTNLFSELDVYRASLYSRPGSVRNLAFNGTGRWIFQALELRYLRARVDSMKINILFMMMLESCSNIRKSPVDPLLEEHARQIQLLSSASNGCISRLEVLEKEMVAPAHGDVNTAISRMSIRSIDSASSARSVRDSILSLWSHDPDLERVLLPREGGHSVRSEEQIDLPRASRLIEELHYPAAADSECGDDEMTKSWSTNDDSDYASGEHLSAPSSAKPMSSSADPYLSPSSFDPEFPTQQNRKRDTVPSTPTDDSSPVGSLNAESSSAKLSDFQPFRVGVEDPCSKVLSDALKKYDVQADWRFWSLWLIDDDQERCLGLSERPLSVFRELTKEGRKPGFVLRRYALHEENQVGSQGIMSTAPLGPVARQSLQPASECLVVFTARQKYCIEHKLFSVC